MPDKKYIFIFCAALLLTFIINSTPIAKKWEMWAYDYRLNVAGSIKNLSDKIALLGIDEDALKMFGQWPWSRSVHARIVDKLTQLKSKSIVYDILFDNPDMHGANNDEVFANSIKNSKRVILPFKFENEEYQTGGKIILPVPVLQNCAAELGFIDLLMDSDGKLRRTQLARVKDDKIYPSLSLATIAFISGVAPRDIKYLDGKIVLGDFVIPTDKNYVVYINFPEKRRDDNETRDGKKLDIFKAASCKKIFELSNKENTVYKNATCFIGATAEGFKDYFVTPSGYLSGIAVHASILNMLMQKKFIVKVNPLYEVILWLILLAVGLFIFPKLKTSGGLAFFAGIIIFYAVVNLILFARGYLMVFIYPVIFVFLIFTFSQMYQFVRTRKLFGQFVAQEMVDEMLNKDSKQKLGGEEKEVSVLFSDIRGYTNLSEKMNPKEIMGFLNEYHSRMSRIFSENKGRIFDYQGDAQMVVFGAPVDAPDHAYLAVKAAVQMREEIEKMKLDRQKDFLSDFNVGIGICTGKVAIGLVGAEEHKQYVAIGDSTNVASRLQGLSKELGCNILVTESTYQKIKERVNAKLFPDIKLKGKAESMNVYGIIDAR